MMSYEEFKRTMISYVSIDLGDDFEVGVRGIIKNNDVRCDAIIAVKNNSTKSSSPTVYLESYYDDYLKGTRISDIALEITKIFRVPSPNLSQQLENLECFDTIKDHICFTLVNTNKCTDLLKLLPHKNVMDLSMICYVNLPNAIIKINHDILSHWGVTEDELMRVAQENTTQLHRPVMQGMSEMFSEMLFDDAMKMNDIELPEPENEMYVLTNDAKIQGAINFLLSDEVEKLSDKLEKDLFILPSSIHEVILVPDNKAISTRDLREMVCEINATQVAPEERLSDSIYKFCRTNKKINMCL